MDFGQALGFRKWAAVGVSWGLGYSREYRISEFQLEFKALSPLLFSCPTGPSSLTRSWISNHIAVIVCKGRATHVDAITKLATVSYIETSHTETLNAATTAVRSRSCFHDSCRRVGTINMRGGWLPAFCSVFIRFDKSESRGLQGSGVRCTVFQLRMFRVSGPTC